LIFFFFLFNLNIFNILIIVIIVLNHSFFMIVIDFMFPIIFSLLYLYHLIFYEISFSFFLKYGTLNLYDLNKSTTLYQLFLVLIHLYFFIIPIFKVSIIYFDYLIYLFEYFYLKLKYSYFFYIILYFSS